jgi:hypothetical protein
MRDRVIGLIYLAVVLSIFTEIKIQADPVNINPTNVLLVALVLITFYDIIKRGRVRKKTFSLFVICGCFLLFGATSFNINVGGGKEHLRSVVTLAKGVIAIFSISYWSNKYKDIEKISKGMIIAGIIAFIGAIIQGYFLVSVEVGGIFPNKTRGVQRLSDLGLSIGLQRASGFLQGFGLLGVYMESAALLSAVGFLSYGRRQGVPRILAILGVVVASVGLLVSQSRSNLVAIIVGYSVFYTLATLVYSRFTIVRMVPLALLIGGLLYYSSELSEIIIALNRNAITQRVEGYWAAFRALRESPVFGIGFSNMRPKMDYYFSIHNSYITLLTGGGVTAFASYVYLNVKAIKEGVLCLKASDPRAPLAIGLLSSLSAAMIECLFWGGGVFATAVFILIGLLVALGQVAYEHPLNA